MYIYIYNYIDIHVDSVGIINFLIESAIFASNFCTYPITVSPSIPFVRLGRNRDRCRSGWFLKKLIMATSTRSWISM